MHVRSIAVISLVLNAVVAMGAAPLKVELAEVKKVWDQAPHNAFTDLVVWRDQFYCAFREGRGHVSTDGRIRVLRSADGDVWRPCEPMVLEGYDLRDAHLSVTPDGRLMLLGGAAPRKKDNERAPTGSFVAFSSDGRQWSEPQIVVQPGRWLWCVTWHQGKGYGVSYPASQGTAPHLELLTSDDGVRYEPLVYKLYAVGRPSEVTLRFDRYGTCYALIRRDRFGDDPYSAVLGVSRGDYTEWQWHDLGPEFNGFGGPNLIQLPTGHWLAAGRMHQDGAHTALCYLDVAEHKMTKLLRLPSGGDTSYTGLVWRDGLLHMSYYASHEGKTSIYLATVKVAYPCPACGTMMKTIPMLVGLPTEEMQEQVRRGHALLAGCVGDPHNPEIACACLNCKKWKTAEMKYWQPLPEDFGASNP